MKNAFLAAAAGALAFVGVLILVPGRQTACGGVTVTFRGVRGATSGTNLIAFAVTNHTSARLELMPVAVFEGNGNAGWPGWLHSPPMFGRKFLNPDESVILEVPEPTSNGVWRAVVSYDPKTRRREYWVTTVQEVGRLFGKNVGVGLPNSRSEWITPTKTGWTNWSEPAR